MNRATAGETDRFRQPLIEHRIELNRPLGLRFMLHHGIGKDAPEFRDDRRIVDENLAGCCRQPSGECRAEGEWRVEPGRWR